MTKMKSEKPEVDTKPVLTPPRTPIHISEEDYKKLVIKDYEDRKAANQTAIFLQEYIYEVVQGHYVLADRTGSACRWCFEHTNQNPFRNCAPGVSVVTLCTKCLRDITILDAHIKGSKKDIVQRRTTVDPEQIQVDWTYVDRLIDNGQAQLNLLVKKYKSTNDEFKEILTAHYGERIVIKKGKGGGILWNPDFKEKKTKKKK